MTTKRENPAKRVDVVRIQLVRESTRLYPSRRISSPSDIVDLVGEFVEDADREKVLAVYLNTKNEPESIHTVSIGSLNAAIVSVREVFKGAILSNAASLIVVHNHPSGDPSCSKEDVEITKILHDAGKLLGISLQDHVIVGANGRYESLKEKGVI